MATNAQVIKLAKDTIQVARAIKSAQVLANQFMHNNSVNDPNWTDLNTPEGHANEEVVDEDGLILEAGVTPSDVSNAIGSIANFLHYYEGTADVAQSAWGNNLEKIVEPIV